jgi:non-specific serine/threonine protein kinase
MKEIIAVFTPDGCYLDASDSSEKDVFFDEALLTEAKTALYRALFTLGFNDADARFSPSLAFLRHAASVFVERLFKSPEIEFTRKAPETDPQTVSRLLDEVPFAVGAENIDEAWIKTFLARVSSEFEQDLASHDGSVAEYLDSKGSGYSVSGKVYFHLVERKDMATPFAFMATYAVENKKQKNAKHLPLANALREFEGRQEKLLQLLATVSRAAESSAFISSLMESGELFSPIKLTADETHVFLKEVEIYEQCGVLCRIPNWWRRIRKTISLKLSLGDEAPSGLGLDALLRFNPSFDFGGEVLSQDEVRQLLLEAEGLLMLKGHWIEVNHEKLRALLAAYENAAASDPITFAEAMRLEMGIGLESFAGETEAVEVTNGEWLAGLVHRLRSPDAESKSAVGPGKDFKATLRPYQETGLRWLAEMHKLGFGALLADDMGLGKTVQVLALLEHLRVAGKGDARTLLVLPASLIGNWRKEAERFAPKLRCRVLHGADAAFSLDEADLFITTYGMVRGNAQIVEADWDIVIADEAQAIKNPGTLQTKAIKKLKGKTRIAMTGTPIENRLSDLWSLFDYMNPGLLGSASEFKEYAARAVKDNNYSAIRNAIAPFMLRRLKTDKSIISDLPDKIEVSDISALTKKQAVLYEKYVSDLKKRLDGAEGIDRRGLVLASLIKLKQICNHPDQYLGQGEYKAAHSGKFEKILEICETIHEKREKVLVFTQFKEITEPLSDCLAGLFGHRGLVLHGGTPTKKRGELVDAFNSDARIPYMVLSLKAGGVGLNLTAANHVVHFDRWWNPAVENQATDRAFRIGQRKNVVVHRFITEGTLEEKIHDMIERKRALAGDIISGAGETWITELGDDELIRLFSLS